MKEVTKVVLKNGARIIVGSAKTVVIIGEAIVKLVKEHGKGKGGF